MADRPTLLDYLIIICKWKKLIAATVLVFVIIAVMAVLLMAPVYQAETRILPPDTDNSSTSTQLLSQMGGIALAGDLFGKKSLSDLYVGLLQSRTVLDRVVDRFALTGVYKVTYREEARYRLMRGLRVNNDRKSGIISIAVEDRDPKRAAELAGSFVEELILLTKNIAVTEASQRRQFYENKLIEAKESLIRSEESMKGFQEKTGAFEIKEQAKAIIESVANLRALIAAKEVNLKVIRTYSQPQNPDLQKAEEELKGLKQQLGKLQAKNGNNPERLMSTGSVPEAGTGYVRQVRDLKYNETLFDLLTKQYEMAKMDESRSSATIQVIDKAVTPEKRSRPKRTKTVALAALIGVISGVLLSFLMENRERQSNDPATRAKMATLKSYAMIHRNRT